MRTSSSEYSTDKTHLNIDYIHLTNNAVQKNAPNYGNFEDGNQLSFGYFRKYLKEEMGVDFDTLILPKMKYYAALAMASVINSLLIYLGEAEIEPKQEKIVFRDIRLRLHH